MVARRPLGAFTSEGRKLIRGVGLDPAVYVTTLKSGAVTLLSATARGKPLPGWSEAMRWSPNGKRIVFTWSGRAYVRTLR